MSETVFLQEGNVTVTNARVVLPRQTYALANITSVRKMRDRESGGPAFLMVFLLAILAAGTTYYLTQSGPLACAVMAIGWAGAFIAMFKFMGWIVLLVTAGSESKALTSRDEAHIDRVIKAINDAIIARG